MFHRCFGSSVLLYDPYLTPTAKSLWTSSIPSEKISFVADLEQELYPRADIISLHIPLLPSTRGLIGARQLQLMKPTAILINTARGGIVDETDLLRALRDGTIYGAGLDSGFAECDNVVMT
jgi:phosphoglycerate dehydrogenase-like enzyme